MDDMPYAANLEHFGRLALPVPAMPTPSSSMTSAASGGGAPAPSGWGGNGPSGATPMAGNYGANTRGYSGPAGNEGQNAGGFFSQGAYNPNYGGQIQMPGLAQGALSLAGFAPGWPGMVAGGINDLIHGYNTAMSANQAQRIGAQPPGIMDFLGGVFGINNRGDTGGNATIAAPGQWTNRLNGEQPAVTQQGLYDSSPFGMFARALGSIGIGNGYFSPTGAMTPGEAMHRNAMAGGGSLVNSMFRGAIGNDRAGTPTASAYGMTPGAAGLFGPAIVAGGGNPNPYQRTTTPDGTPIGGGNAVGNLGAGNGGQFNAGANIGYGAGNYASSTGAPSGPAVTSGGGWV